MASFADTNAAAVENQVWDTQVLQARFGKAVISKVILNKSELVSDSGQIIHIPIKPRFSGGDVTQSTGAFTPEAPTLTDVQVNVNTWKYVSVEIVEKTSKQSIVTLETELPSQFGERLAEFYDIDLANLFGSFTGFDGVTGGLGLGTPGTGIDFDDSTATAAVAFLRRRNIPLDGLSWILPIEAWYYGWLLKERLTTAYATGLDKSVIITNSRQPIFGIPAMESNLLNGTTAVDDSSVSLNPASGPNVAGTTAAFLVHKEAMAIAMQINNKYRRYDAAPAGRLANGIVASELYGKQVVRANHALPIYVRNNK